MQQVYEIVVFKTKDGVTPEQAIESARALQPILDAYPGYVRRELIQSGENQWVDWVVWESMEQAMFAANDIMSKPEAVSIMSVIDEQEVTIVHGHTVFEATNAKVSQQL